MSTIIYLQDGDTNPVMDLIKSIASEGIAGDHDSIMLAKYITDGLSKLREIGIPPDKRHLFTTENEDGYPITFNILKELSSAPPLLEFRVNRTEPGAFRAIFFEYVYQGEVYLVFTQALIKKGDPNPPELQQAINKSLRQYRAFRQKPENHL